MVASAVAERGSLVSRAPRSRHLPASDVLGWILTTILFVLVGLPLAFVLLQSVFPGIGLAREWGFQPWLLGEILNRPLWQRSLGNSLLLAGGAMVVGGAFGSALAVLRHSVAFPGARLLDACAWVLLVSPSFILAQGWVMFASPSGIATNSWGMPWVSDLIFSPGGLIVIMSLTQYPLAYLATSGALHWEDRSAQAAAALSGAGRWTILRTIRIPLLAPAVLSGAVLVFVDVIGDFGLPAALSASYSFPTLPYSIYASVRQSPVSFELAGVLSLYLVAILAVAIVLYMRVLRRSRYDFLSGTATRTAPPPAKRPWIWTAVTVAVIGVTIVLPLSASLQVSLSQSISGGFAVANFTLEHYAAILASGSRLLEGAANSLMIALVVGLVTAVLGFLIGVVLTFTSFRARAIIDVAGTVALAIPGIVLAVGYIFVWNQPILSSIGLGLYGQPVLLVLAGIATAVPVAVRLQLGALAQVPPALLHSAALSGVGLLARLRTVLVPLVAPALLSALIAVFASSVFDLAATTMLAPPSFATLPVEILLEYDRGKYGYATAGAIFSAVVVVGIAALAAIAGRALIRRADAAGTPLTPAPAVSSAAPEASTEGPTP